MPELPYGGEDERMPWVGDPFDDGPDPDDDWDEDYHHFHGPIPDQDDLNLGPVVDLYCTSCKRWTEHVVCESDGDLQERRCSQCFAWSKGTPEPISYDPTTHAEMIGTDEETDDADFPF